MGTAKRREGKKATGARRRTYRHPQRKEHATRSCVNPPSPQWRLLAAVNKSPPLLRRAVTRSPTPNKETRDSDRTQKVGAPRQDRPTGRQRGRPGRCGSGPLVGNADWAGKARHGSRWKRGWRPARAGGKEPHCAKHGHAFGSRSCARVAACSSAADDCCQRGGNRPAVGTVGSTPGCG